MNTQRIAKGWALIAEGAMELSLAYEAIEPPAARAGVSGAEGAQAGPPQPPPHPTDLPPPHTEEDRLANYPSTYQQQHVATVLGQCPDHQTSWRVVPAGVSKKTGKPYSAFYSCSERDCKKRPVKAWEDSHPIREAA